MTRDELEFLLSQYHDGTLPPLERDRADEILANDASARAILAEYQKLDVLVRQVPGAPSLDWDRVHARFSGAVTESGDLPVARSFQISRYRWIARSVAAAALVVIIVGVVFRASSDKVRSDAAPKVQIVIGPAASNATIDVVAHDVLHARPSDRAVAQVSIGPAPEVTGALWRYDDSVIVRPSRVIIAAGGEPAQDGGASPF
jgi:hypothetical protein